MNSTDADTKLLTDVLRLVHDERDAARRQLHQIWDRPLRERIRGGFTQRFAALQPGPSPGTLWAVPDDGESRFREGDLLFLHRGDVLDPLSEQLVFELEENDRWLLRGPSAATVLERDQGGECFADPDALDLTSMYERALHEIATSDAGRGTLLPLLAGRLPVTFDERDMDEARSAARDHGFNDTQADAVAWAYGARLAACVQGPPGSGKTRVLAMISRLGVARGERILVTSHTHTAINAALNRVHAHGVPVVKVGRATQRRGLDPAIQHEEYLAAWDDRPTDGYVVGATPFATCTARLADFRFDTVIFDEASQITVPLALMAMRVARRFIFIGDQAQLPPVLLSRSVLDGERHSIFGRLTSDADHLVMLDRTYRMNRWLARWPSATYYGGRLVAAGPNRDRRLRLTHVPDRLAAALDGAHPAVFITSPDPAARTRSASEAALVAELCGAAVDGGIEPRRIGVVSPYRMQGRAIRAALRDRLGPRAAGAVVADTVERMQGQERELIVLSLVTGDTGLLATIADFFFQPQRLNVAITRAMTKLVVIGPDPACLPTVADPTVARWVDQYRDLVANCRAVQISG